MRIKPSFSDTAFIKKSRLVFKIGKWRLYKVTFLRKEAMLLVDHEIKDRYKHLHRLTNYKFIGLQKYENHL